MVVADLHHPLGPQRCERQLLPGVPAAASGPLPAAPLGLGLLLPGAPVPRVPLEAGPERLELDEQLPPALHREGADHPDAGQLAGVGVQPQQQRPNQVRAPLVQPVAAHHAVGGPLMLDLRPHPPIRLVDPVQRLGEHPVQPGALEPRQPPGGQVAVGGRRRQVHRRPHPGQGLV
jgi:hypothetical protein